MDPVAVHNFCTKNSTKKPHQLHRRYMTAALLSWGWQTHPQPR